MGRSIGESFQGGNSSSGDESGTTVPSGLADGHSAAITGGLAFIDSLSRTEQTAFLGLFAGARFPWHSFNGRRPTIGKAECEWVEDWRDFYGVRLKEAGLFRFEGGEPLPALGGAPGTTYVLIDCGPTALGRAVREAWWERRKRRAEGATNAS